MTTPTTPPQAFPTTRSGSLPPRRQAGLRLMTRLLVFFTLTLAAVVQAQAPAPGAQTLGPQWLGQHVDVRGVVIAWDRNCRQIEVTRNGFVGVGGRVWACYANGHRAPALGEQVRVRGVVSDTRMTRMGSRWRVVPLVRIPTKR